MPASIWLEMENARAESGALEIQIKGDRTKKEPDQPWWPVVLGKAVPGEKDVFAALNKLFDALDKKRVVLAELKAQAKDTLVCTGIRIQYSESERR